MSLSHATKSYRVNRPLHGTFFKMADNTVSDSDSSWEEYADEGPINPIAEAKRLGANLAIFGKTKERKIHTNPAAKKRCTCGQNDLNRKETILKGKHVENKSNFSATLEIKKELFKGARLHYFRSFCLILLIMSSKRQIGRARVFHLQNHGLITTENDFPAV